MRHRLKIAWTAFFAVLTVALCVLWVRSYWYPDEIDFVLKDEWAIGSINGSLFAADLWTPYSTTFHYWYLVLVAILLAVTPWLPIRFSLRTMLIVTTLVAVVLGIVAWSMRE